MDSYRVFVSSPGDALRERQRLDLVVRRLNGEFAGQAQLVAVRWESSFYQAHATFQAQIPEAGACDLVVAIFRGRLGTELPPNFERMADGEPYPSGTAYEVLTAIDKRQHGAELPDVYVFRCPEPPSIKLDDAEGEAATRAQWERLKGFFARFFVTPEGRFKAAFQTFTDTDDFERQIERLLREWLSRKVLRGREAVWPIAIKGSPFPGLRAYEAKHAAVFFGRSRDTTRALDALCAAASHGTPFLLIVGASGSGKSSLLRAGIAPRLVTPGVVEAVDAWCLAEMRPGEGMQGPIAALASALMRKPAEAAADAGLPPALPEIAEGAYASDAELAGVLAHADAAAVKPIIEALGRVSTRLAQQERLAREARCDLVLLIDQLDELFAASVSEDERARFARLLAALAATRRVWIGVTLRADLYELMLREPSLFALKEQGSAFDLSPPGLAELAEIVRKPAELAGLVYERDATSGEGLDERLLRDADRPDMLPLLQLALARLFEARETRGEETLLTLRAYEAQGGLSGIIDRAGEEAIATLDAPAVACLPRLLRHLAEPSHGREGAASLTTRDARLAEAAPDAPSGTLVAALVEARLLQSRGEGGETVIRLSHQRVLTDWARSRASVEDSADFYRIREETEARRAAYEAAGRRAELLLPRGLPLAQAESMLRRYGEELSPQARAYVAASRRRAHRAQALTGLAACLFALLAVGAGIFAKVAADQRQAARLAEREAQAQRAIAERNLAAAETAIHGLTFDVAQGLRDVAGMRVETVHNVLERVRRSIDTLGEVATKDPVLLRDRAAMLQEFVTTYRQAGDLGAAEAAARESLGNFRRLADLDPDNPKYQHDLMVAENALSGIEAATGKRPAALAAAERGLGLARAVAAKHPDAPDAELDIASALNAIGGLKLAAADRGGALAAYDEALAIMRKLAARDPDNSEWLIDLSVSLDTRAELLLADKDAAGALAAHREALAIDRKFVSLRPDDGKWSVRLVSTLNGLADAELAVGDVPAALIADTEALAISRALVARDPGNLEWQRNLAVALGKLADAKLAAGDRDAAIAAYQQALDTVRAVAAHDPDNAEWQRGISVGLERLTDLKLKAGDFAGAKAGFDEILAIRRALSRRDPGNADWSYDLALALDRVAAVAMGQGDRDGALAIVRENIAVMQGVVARDPANAAFAQHLARSLEEVAGWRAQGDDPAAAASAWDEAAAMRRNLLAERPDDGARLDALILDLDILGGMRYLSNDYPKAAEAYGEEVALLRRRLALGRGAQAPDAGFADALDHLAATRDMLKDPSGELAARRESLAIRRALLEKGGGDAKSLAALGTDFGYVIDLIGTASGPEEAGAIAQEALSAAKVLTGAEPADVQRLGDVAQRLAGLANLRAAAGAKAEAILFDEEAAAVARRLQAMAPTDERPIMGLALLLDRIGDWKAELGDRQGALAASRELLATERRLLALHPGVPLWRVSLAYALVKTAEQSDDGAEALGEARAILKDLDGATLEPPLRNFMEMVDKRVASADGPKAKGAKP
ncbi:AAA ATPase domain-containing protein [Rhizobiales bacterium GAS113]|nr:AAA ATPase domain-containing protein [Rhizobiales bacterium GAS113]